MSDKIILSSLLYRVTPEEAEREHMVDGVAFGHSHAEWNRLKALLQESDELWFFRTSWQAYPNRSLEGYAITCRGELIEQIFTRIIQL